MSIGTTTQENSISLLSSDITKGIGEMANMKFNFDPTDFSTSRIDVPEFNSSSVSLPGN
ncbi:hypothetical protein AOB58_803 [Staphylococcus sp. AntiMn-1]|uniref:hypothetical protein n=1 Tax=Staphylococcus TaxID=1279 RepID=UPI0007F0B4FC|nr:MULTISPECIES: hypothetical protein [Staphylococcus]ANK37605.1 hypothetical protein AOB58_803 [Staphylococcus sp. AntiMn-1]